MFSRPSSAASSASLMAAIVLSAVVAIGQEVQVRVTEVDVDDAEGDILVLSPTRSEQTDRAPASQINTCGQRGRG